MTEQMELPPVLLLFGLPCVGKTSFANEVATMYHGATIFSVDRTIREMLGHEPCKEDFRHRSAAVLAYIEQCIPDRSTFVVVEVGCLVPCTQAEAFMARLRLTHRVLSLELTCEWTRTRNRAAARNLAILNGQSDAVIIDNPDMIYEFATIYERPADIITLESDHVSPSDLAQQFLTKWTVL